MEYNNMIENYNEYLSLALQTKSKYETLLAQLKSVESQKEEIKTKMDESFISLRTYEASIEYII